MYQLNFSLQEFVQNYWQKKPVVIKSGFADFVDPITAEELAGLSLEEDVDSRFISNADDSWVAEHGPLEEDKFSTLGESHWQLVVQAANHWHAGAAALVTPFKQIPQWIFDDVMISYSTPNGGVGPHIDQYDVFIIQGLGKRHWRVGDIDQGQYEEVIQANALRQIKQFDAIIDEVLEPGDILYIPPGFPHEGYALENSLSYSIGYRTPKEQELLSNFADFYLAQNLGEEHVSTANMALQNNFGEITPASLQQLTSIIEKSLKQENLMKDFIGTMLSQPRHQLDIVEPELAYSKEQIAEELTYGSTLVKVSGLKAFYHADFKQFNYVNGEAFSIGGNDSLIDKLCNHESFNVDELTDTSETTIALLTELINKGYWYFED